MTRSIISAACAAVVSLCGLTASLTAVIPAAYADGIEWEYEGLAEVEGRHFSASDNPRGLDRTRWSVSGEVTVDAYADRDNPHMRLTVFGRHDPFDDRRSHLDVRAAFVEYLWDSDALSGDVKVGLDKEFWGVLESAHLVDIINQTDFVEAIDGEDKLGQPMVQLGIGSEWGTVRLFVMPYFRERTFPGFEGRPHPGITIDPHRATYESSREEKHVDVALRYTHVIGDWDVGLSHFDGTARAPQIQPTVVGFNGRQPIIAFVPFYAQLSQTSLDLQATKGAWLLKLEALTKEELGTRHEQGGLGFEYTLYGVLDSDADLGLVGEYLWDERSKPADNAFDNDVFAGIRYALNDVQSTSVLLGGIFDLDGDAISLAVEAETRLGDAARLTVEYRGISQVNPTDPLAAFADDDFLEIRLGRFF
ncbi:MAG: hypothetical protein ABF335_12660 [Alphaproteobacteria bacterium]